MDGVEEAAGRDNSKPAGRRYDGDYGIGRLPVGQRLDRRRPLLVNATFNLELIDELLSLETAISSPRRRPCLAVWSPQECVPCCLAQ